MKPLNCCKDCSGLKDGKFRNKIKCTFCEEYAKELVLKLYNEQKKVNEAVLLVHIVNTFMIILHM